MADPPTHDDEFVSFIKQRIDHKIKQFEKCTWESTQMKMTSIANERQETKKQIYSLLETATICSPSQQTQEFCQKMEAHLNDLASSAHCGFNKRIEVDDGVINISFEPLSTADVVPEGKTPETSSSIRRSSLQDSIHVAPPTLPSNRTKLEDRDTSRTVSGQRKRDRNSSGEPLHSKRRQKSDKRPTGVTPTPPEEIHENHQGLMCHTPPNWPIITRQSVGEEYLFEFPFESNRIWVLRCPLCPNQRFKLIGADIKWATKHNSKFNFWKVRDPQFQVRYPYINPPDRKPGAERQPDRTAPTPARPLSGGGQSNGPSRNHTPRQPNKADCGRGNQVVFQDDVSGVTQDGKIVKRKPS
ncbi:hypothetical protein PFICI_03907 [Pestalotiopsis fici W106-1]|uniref:Uncharacterized protein n=1 Tax=Pestalotiopsis fici (strain W106-1 / CGMCC3.15140) TaxID=1229662 RepID=W3XK92_PESFW|nr:uncharacterized protein PFICI_03907 [Pestalotiopsis fici W106-1]ETS85882.1 hypothetical protein PFICI_03907 [Pestalotiopsis fici W106-1]